MFFSRLYFCEGDCFKLNFFFFVDISGMKSELNVLKGVVKEIVDVLERQFFDNSCIENDYIGLLRFFYCVQVVLEKFVVEFFYFWKCIRIDVYRYFFV